MRTWVMVLGWIGFLAGLILGALGLAGYGPRLALELAGVVLLVLGAATEGYYFGARSYLKRAQPEGQKVSGPR